MAVTGFLKNTKTILKQFLRKIPVPLSKNHQYDLEAKKIIKRVCTASSNCVDVGAHDGDFLDIFLQYAPKGMHFGFEPIPNLYQKLTKKYQQFRNVAVFDTALSNTEGTSEFNYVITNPAYSGIKKRLYDRKHEQETILTVKTNKLDHLIPDNVPVHFIKIDVEGAELFVLEGAARIIGQYSPVIIFEFGLGGSDIYGTSPEKIYNFFSLLGYDISLLSDYLKNKQPLTLTNLQEQFHERKNYYFIASKQAVT